MQVPTWPTGIAVSPCFLFYFAHDIKDVMLFVGGGGFLLPILDWLLLCGFPLLLQGGRCEHTGTYTHGVCPSPALHTAIGSLLVQLTGEKSFFPSPLQRRGEIVFLSLHTSIALAILTAWRSHERLGHPLPIHGRNAGSLTLVP